MMPTIIPKVDAGRHKLRGGSSAVGRFIGEMQAPVTGKVSLSFPQDDTACICRRLSWITKWTINLIWCDLLEM